MAIVKVSDRDGCLIEKIAVYIPDALKAVPELVIAVDVLGEPMAFMGIEHRKLEMLFISSEMRRNGVGKQPLQYGIQEFSVNELGVNEQNPYPIIYMKREYNVLARVQD